MTVKFYPVIVMAGFAATAAHGQSITSVYSDFDIARCKTISKFADGIDVLCKGIKGYDVRYTEGDLRGTASFGPNAKKQCSHIQTFGAFNSIGKKVEWRMVKGKPLATIMRWFTDNGEPGGKQNWLVVTKLEGKDACRSAIIDTKFPNANVLAQQKADSSASFNCEKDRVEVISNATVVGAEAMSSSPCGKAPYGLD